MKHDDIVNSMLRARFGKLPSALSSGERALLVAEMVAFRNARASGGKAAVTPAAIRNWIILRGTPPRTSTIKRIEALRFVYDFLIWARENNIFKADGHEAILSDSFGYLASILSLKANPGGLHHVDFDSSDFLFKKDPAVGRAVKSIVYTSSKNRRSEMDDLFPGSIDEKSDDSYFVMYRYSTNRGNVVKSFLQIRTPEDPGSDTFLFNHHVWCTRDALSMPSEDARPTIFRECGGVVAKMQTSYYLIGSNFSIKNVDKFKDPVRYETVRANRSQRPDGLGMITFEYDAFRHNPGLISGLTMTLAADDQPIIARVALLHLGTRSSFGKAIDDEIIRPAELSPHDLEDDLRLCLRRVGGIKSNGFSEYVSSVLSDPGETAIRRLKDTIINLISNKPAWDRNPADEKRSEAEGAIETIGPMRPRD